MSNSTPFLPDDIPLDLYIDSFEGAEIARMVSIGFFALIIYEWAITLDKEVEYFWSGEWNFTRILFLMNRYIPPMIMLLGLICFFVPNPTNEFCKPAIQTSFITSTIAIGIIQAILVMRAWYLFSGNRPVQSIVLSAFGISLAVSLAFTIVAARDLRLLERLDNSPLRIPGCRAERPKDFWRIFIPSLVLHTVLYFLTAFRAWKSRRLLENAPVLKRLLRDGGFFYLVVFVSVGFTAVGSFLTQYPRINIPVIFSNYLISVTSIAVSRVMLSIHSLAANLGSDTTWLLSNAQLSRVGWRVGSRPGEIIVDRWSDDLDQSVWMEPATSLKMTRVGALSPTTW